MPTASEIIERVKARYAGCRSYEDTGNVDIRIGAGTKIADTFRTAFHRETGFTFELSRNGLGHASEHIRGRGIGWARRDGVWWSIPSRHRLGLDYDLTRARGEIAMRTEFGSVSVPAVATAALSLLMTDRESVFSLFSTLVRVKSVARHSTDCFVLRGPQATIGTSLWIEASSCFVREFRGPVDVHDLRAECKIVWHPRMDHDIDPKVFEFAPPG